MDIRTKIEQSFKDLVCASGYQKVTVSDICDSAHVSRKTFYEYFHNKEDVVRSYFDRTTIESLRFMHENLAYLSNEDLLRTQCQHLYYSIERDKEFYTRLIGEGLDDTGGVFVRSVTSAIMDLNAEVFSRWVEGDSKSWQAEYAAYFFASSQAMLVKKWIQEGMTVSPSDLGELYIRMTSNFWLSMDRREP